MSAYGDVLAMTSCQWRTWRSLARSLGATSRGSVDRWEHSAGGDGTAHVARCWHRLLWQVKWMRHRLRNEIKTTDNWSNAVQENDAVFRWTVQDGDTRWTATCSAAWPARPNSGNERSAIVHCTDARLVSPRSAELLEHQTCSITTHTAIHNKAVVHCRHRPQHPLQDGLIYSMHTPSSRNSVQRIKKSRSTNRLRGN